MPIINVRYAAGSLDQQQKSELAHRLTDALIRMEGGANTQGGRSFAWVLFTELACGDWWVGGMTGDDLISSPCRFLVHVAVPEGYMNAEHKNEVHAWVTEAILAATGTATTPSAGSGILVVVNEVPEGNWGWAGHPISLERIADSVGLDKSGERFTWSKSYFAAKSRMLDAAGYPADIGGLIPSQQRRNLDSPDADREAFLSAPD